MGNVKIQLARYINNNDKSSSFGKTYARINHAGTLNTRGIAKHIAEHGSIYTYDVVAGVLASLERCIPEMLLQGFKVKLDGLGTFSLGVNTKGEVNAADFSIQHNVLGLRMNFLGDKCDYSIWKKRMLEANASFELMQATVVHNSDGSVTIQNWTGKPTSDDGGVVNPGTSGGNSGGNNSGGDQDDPIENRP